MADRSIRVVLRAEIDSFKRSMAEAAKATDALPASARKAEAGMGRLMESANRNREAWERAGGTMATFGTATLVGLGLAVKAAMDWESAWTGVLKTVDGSAAELDALEASLREMARTLPASHTEIAAVAEAAGQLGVQTGNVAAFTRVMIDLGETTNLSADQAATALARFSNIMGTSQGDVSRLGSTLVGLGNNFATTESEILDMAMRLAGAGRQMGLTEGETLGLAAAMSSVGIEAEAGGSAMSLTMKRINSEVENSGPKLALFAQVAGMSAAEFSQAWGEDAAGALSMFVAGLGNTEAIGLSTTQVLAELGVTGIRESDALLRLSSASDVLTESLTQGNAEFEANNVLTLEAAKRYETTEARMAMAKNAIADTAITLGETFLPMIAKASDAVAGFAEWVGEIPAPVLNASAAMAGMVGAAALTGGAFLTIFPRAMDTIDAFKKLAVQSPRTAGALSGVGKAAGIAAGAAGVGLLTAALVDMIPTGERAALSIEETTSALLGLNEANLFAISGEIGDIGDALDALIGGNALDSVNRFGKSLDDLFGVEIMQGLHEAEDQFAAIGESLALMVGQGQDERAGAIFAGLAAEAEAAGYSVDDLRSVMPAYTDALARVENETTLAGEATQGFADETWTAADAVDSQVDALEELITAQARASGKALSLRDAQRGFQEATAAATAELEKNGPTLDITTEAGRRNQAALDDIASAGWDVVDSLNATGATEGELRESMRQTRESFIAAAESMGMSTEEAKALADQLGLIPNQIAVDISADTTNATNALDQFILLASGRKVYVDVEGRQTGFWNGPGTMPGLASGGHVRGPGTSTSDSIPARLSDGEYVIRAAAVQRYGVAAFDDLNAMRFSQGGYASRGAAPSASLANGDTTNIGPFHISALDGDDVARKVAQELAWNATQGLL